MCGIFGIIRKNQNTSEAELKKFTRTMAHRGPDGEGFFLDNNLGLGHRRLSIIDLEGGAQPMQNITKEYVISFNGEIYNYKELQEELKTLGYQFITNSDTEVVINAYIEWGEKSLSKIRGMFAFGLIDYKRSALFLARDHSGIKPLVYRQEEDYFSFASEIKALDKIDSQAQGEIRALSDFMQYGFVPAPFTIYKNIFKLKAGHYKIVDFDGQVKEDIPFWKPTFSKSKLNLDSSNYLKILDETLSDSIRAHMVSDLPVGVFLSGGVDSTLVALKMKELSPDVEAFTIGFQEQEYNELEYAEKAAKKIGIKLNSKILSNTIYEDLPEILSLYDEPFGDDSAVPTWHVSQFAKQKYSVVLSGDGADELFAGYWRYLDFIKRNNYRKSSLKKRVKKMLPLINGSVKTKEVHDLVNFNTRLNFKERQQLLQTKTYSNTKIFNRILKSIKHYSLLEKLQFIDFKLYLPYNINVKVDIASMSHSLEVRPVFLDKKIFNLAFKTEGKYKLKKEPVGIGKLGLKQILNMTFDDDFVYRTKKGFSSPIKELFYENNVYYKFLIKNLKSTAVNEVLNTNCVIEMLDEHNEKGNRGYALFTILSFVIWQNNNPYVKFKNQ